MEELADPYVRVHIALRVLIYQILFVVSDLVQLFVDLNPVPLQSRHLPHRGFHLLSNLGLVLLAVSFVGVHLLHAEDFLQLQLALLLLFSVLRRQVLHVVAVNPVINVAKLRDVRFHVDVHRDDPTVLFLQEVVQVTSVRSLQIRNCLLV